MFEIVQVARIIVVLLLVALFWITLFVQLVKQAAWRTYVPWFATAMTTIPVSIVLGYLVGALYPFPEGTEGGMIGFGMAGVINAIFIVAHPLTTSAWYMANVSTSSRDFPVTIRILACIGGGTLGAMILAFLASPFLIPVEVARLKRAEADTVCETFA